MIKHLHVVCLDNPYPPDYGGAIDMYNRIIALHQAGIQIHLHYFNYNNRTDINELSKYCTTIQAYKRKSIKSLIQFTKPYIVQSRINQKLISNLNQDNYPVFLEGLHCTGIIPFLSVQRKIMVRMHNDEAIYYEQLALAETKKIKKFYFKRESKLIEEYNYTLNKDIIYAAISVQDVDLFINKYHLKNTFLLPVFFNFPNENSVPGFGNYILYHANLSIAENEAIVKWMATHIFPYCNASFIIAGKMPSNSLKKAIAKFNHVQLIENPSGKYLGQLIKLAHINLLLHFNKKNTGLRIKLFHALYGGRHCLVNQSMVQNTFLENLCEIADTSTEILDKIENLFKQSFTKENVENRTKILIKYYNNEQSIQKIIKYLW